MHGCCGGCPVSTPHVLLGQNELELEHVLFIYLFIMVPSYPPPKQLKMPIISILFMMPIILNFIHQISQRKHALVTNL